MCGISGFYSNSLSTFDNAIIKMNSAIYHRGPDTNGQWYDKNSGVVLGHQRLSIIDLSKSGNQPMQSNSGRLVLTYNGEIYNHLDIRNELKKVNTNINWKSNSDTETLLEAIEFWGVAKTLKKIEGMFAFGVWDKKSRCLTLVRDRMGEKPLYYGWQGDGKNKVFLFGSELKALKAHPKFIGEINRNAIALQLRYGYIPAPYSIYKDIYKILPGNYLQLTEKSFQNSLLPSSKKYWSFVDAAVSGVKNPLTISKEKIVYELENQLRSSIKKQMISDVPIGAFLSGGIDSSTIVALMQQECNHKLKTFSIGSTEGDYDEAKYAKEVAKHLGTDHTELYISAKQSMAIIPKLSEVYDEPFADSSQIPTFFVSQLAKQKVTVSLSGDGGDELFCGYNRYVISKNFWDRISLLPLSFRKLLAAGIQSISPEKLNNLSKLIPSLKRYSNLGDKMHKGSAVIDSKSLPELYYRLISSWQNPNEVVINGNETGTFLTSLKPDLKELDDQQKMMALDTISYLSENILVKVDRAAMASSLETRVPFLDHKLVEYAWKIPQSLKLKNNQGKWILRQILYKYVPKELIERPKMGFEIPIDIWLRGPLKDWAESLLNKKRLNQEGYLNHKFIYAKWKEHLSGKKNWKNLIWNVLMFQSWLDVNKK